MKQQTVTGPGSQTAPCRSTLNPSAREWFPPGYTTISSEQSREQHDPGQAQAEVNSDAVFPVHDCPMEILSSVVGFLGSPQDLVSCLLASQQLQAAVRSGCVSFELTGRPRQLLSYPSKSGQLDDLVQSLIQYMPAMSSCNLSMLPLEHRHVSKLAQGLPLLQHLDLSSCKKLQPSMTPQLLQGLASRQLQSLNLQRCFQLTDACLTGVLEYACASHSSSKALQCIALSHLNLAAWPAAADAAAVQIALQHDSNTNSNNDLEAASSSSSGGGSSQAAATSCDNNRASSSSYSSSGSTAAEWQAVAAGLLSKLPKQLGVALRGAGAAALRVVVLNNCSLLPVEGLLSLAVACPSLEYLFLGGSTLKPPALLPAVAAGGAAGQGGEAIGAYVPRFAASGGAGGAAPFEVPAALQQLSELLHLPSSLPWEVLSSCCGAGSCSSGCGQQCCSCPCSCCSQARASAQNRGGASSEGQDPELERARKRLHRNAPSAAAVATARVHALGLAYVAALLPGLKVLEVSFMAPGLAGWLRVCLEKLHQLRQQQQGVGWSGPGSSSISSMGAVLGGLERVDSSSSSGSARSSSGGGGVVMTVGQQRPKVWQFSCVTSVADALQTLADARRVSSSSSSATSSSITSSNGDHGDASSSSGSNGVSPTCLAMAVRCAVNCSNRGRGTPLHMAADAGCACHIRALLAAGAAVAARDASGASPLFVACESGQAAAAAVLLEGGADALMGNTAGETPLYIAALRGHLSVVEVLLGHLSAADVDWTQRQLYGDAWTPLMAAAVANRVSVAMCLLHAAAMGCCGSKQRAAAGAGNIPATFSSSSNHPWKSSSVSSCHSYNSSSGRHVQQMGRGSGGSSPGVVRLLAAENRYGQTVLHIAARKGCRELLQLLLLYGAGQVAGGVADAAGDTPLDIARRHGHEMAVRELMQKC